MKDMIEVTGIDLVQFTKNVYDISVPMGLGFLQFQPGGLSDEDAKKILDVFEENENCALDMDYVRGRQCKMKVYRGRGENKGKLFINAAWYDHTDDKLELLLSLHGIMVPEDHAEHKLSCECRKCRKKDHLENGPKGPKQPQ